MYLHVQRQKQPSSISGDILEAGLEFSFPFQQRFVYLPIVAATDSQSVLVYCHTVSVVLMYYNTMVENW